MKKRLFSLFLVFGLVLFGILGITACDGEKPPVTPQKLTAPTVTLNGNLASWAADANADKFEISLDGNLSYVENTVTTKTLTDGQTFKIRAVGNGTSYTTSDWSRSVTYTAGGGGPAQPTKLATPSVSISASGLAVWQAVANADGYVYKINGGAEVPTTVTSVQLTDGQSITVKAVGNGSTYTDSDYSAAKTYTASGPSPTGEPSFLGIFASNDEPTAGAGLPGGLTAGPALTANRLLSESTRRSFEDAMKEFFSDSKNHPNGNLPTSSAYSAYSTAGETVYVQIWLDNPDQHTILSLKLNGTKCQVGHGGLSSFFIEEGGRHYNCVYVPVEIPADAHTKIDYTVTDIEYIEGTYINADGTDEFMNENDTVSIGLPYAPERPAISDFGTPTLTVNSLSASLTLSDVDLAEASGGWLGVALYDGYNILASKSLAAGSNTLTASGLVESTYYRVIVYLYADLHDGRGLVAHTFLDRRIETPSAITVSKAEGVHLYDTVRDGYYGAIEVKTTLNSTTAEYVKLEILNGAEEVVYTSTSYNGSAAVSEGILCGADYRVRVYYKDTEYPDGKYIEEYAYVGTLGTPWYNEAGVYSFVDDAIYYFQLNNGDQNYPIISSLTLHIYDEESPRWVAESILLYLEDPHALEELNIRIDELHESVHNYDRGSAEQLAILDEIERLGKLREPLEKAEWYLDYRAESRELAYWQEQAALGKYFYTLTYDGTDSDKIFKIGKTFYVVLEDIIGERYASYDIEILYQYDGGNGEGLSEGRVEETEHFENHFLYAYTDARDVTLNGNELTFSLVNIDDYMNPDGGESVYNKGYVYKIYTRGEYNNEILLYQSSGATAPQVDEAGWMAEYLRRLRAGESVDGLAELYVSKYEDSYTVSLDLSVLDAHEHIIYICTRMLAGEYDEEHEYDHEVRATISVYKKASAPTISFYGEGGVVRAEGVPDDCEYAFEAEDKDGNPVEIELIGWAENGRQFALPAIGTKVRAKVLSTGNLLDSDFSDWYTFDGIPVAAPALGEYNRELCTVGWSVEDHTYIEKVVYTLGGGTEISVALDEHCSVVLDNNDVLRVKCVASTEGIANGYRDSEWVSYTCTDTRTALAVPNLRLEDSQIVWDEVAGATFYLVEQTYNGRTTTRPIYKTSTSAPNGATIRIRAIPEAGDQSKPSAWSAPITVSNSEKG